MKLSDIKLMFEELNHIRSVLIEYQDTLEDREWSNFCNVLLPHLARFDWVLDTLDEELREWD